MTAEIDTLLDRRRLRRRLSLWRALAIGGIVVALFALAAAGDRLTDALGGKQIARVAIEGTILESRDQLQLLKRIGEADNVKAVLVFVNSPGGTTTGGEALFGALRDARQEEAGGGAVRDRGGVRRLHRRARRATTSSAAPTPSPARRRAHPVAGGQPDARQDRGQGQRDQKRPPKAVPSPFEPLTRAARR